jgi:hypothetical protein
MKKPGKIFIFFLIVAIIGSFFYYWRNKEMFHRGANRLHMDMIGYDGSNPLVVLKTQLITPHFNIHTELDLDHLDYYEKFFEGFYEYFDREIFPIKQSQRLEVYLFNDMKHYWPFAEFLEGPNCTPYGFYYSRLNVMVVNASTGLGTVTHEMAHHFTKCGFKVYPAGWIKEGVSTYFEKFIGYLDEDGELNITFGYHSNLRIPVARKYMDRCDLMTFMRYASQPHVRSFVMYLHERGKFLDFIRAAADAEDDYHGIASLGKAYGRPFDEVAREVADDWDAWARSLPDNNQIFLVEESFVKTYDEWQVWWGKNKHRLYYDDERKIYRVKADHIKPVKVVPREDGELGVN